MRRPPEEVGIDAPTFDNEGWEVEEEIANADWQQVCVPCSAGCRECADPSPRGCRACFPLHDLGPAGCVPSLSGMLSLAVGTVLILALAWWITRHNYNKYMKIRTKRQEIMQKKKSK